MTISGKSQLSSCEVQFKRIAHMMSSPEIKVFQGFNVIRTRGLCVRAAVLYQLSYEDCYVQAVLGLEEEIMVIIYTPSWLTCDKRLSG